MRDGVHPWWSREVTSSRAHLSASSRGASVKAASAESTTPILSTVPRTTVCVTLVETARLTTRSSSFALTIICPLVRRSRLTFMRLASRKRSVACSVAGGSRNLPPPLPSGRALPVTICQSLMTIIAGLCCRSAALSTRRESSFERASDADAEVRPRRSMVSSPTPDADETATEGRAGSSNGVSSMVASTAVGSAVVGSW
mmetsp:Transcript_57327/g.127970  ORF Transcript_57327/g.127970 Transcript_57327/m.127970 type:complete len:200 (+) Transcript_57327:277-876(+)